MTRGASELVRLRRGRGTSANYYRCSVPGLAGFAVARLHGVRSLITQTQSWRRGWDSNPRYGFPYTAFPVLPVQPLLHLSERMRDEGCIRESGSFIHPLSFALQRWRRGWDSNPRYPYEHNGFRDRPIQPLSHLSALVMAFRFSRKKDCIIARHSCSRMPPSTITL